MYNAEANIQKMEKQRDMDKLNPKALMEAVHDVLSTKENETPCTAPCSQRRT